MSSYPTTMNMVKIAAVEDVIGYRFDEPSLIWEALQAAGSGVERIGNRRIIEGNKNLALVGDAALKLILVKDGYSVGAALRTVSNVVTSTGSNANLASIGFAKSLENSICANPSHFGPISHGMMATAIEAIIGAVYLDTNMNIPTVKLVMTALGLIWSE